MLSFQLMLNDSNADHLNDKVVSFSVSDESGIFYDELNLSVALTKDLELPKKSDALSIKFGQAGLLYEWGPYQIQELQGEPNLIRVRAFCCTSYRDLKNKVHKSWDAPVGEIVSSIAKSTKLDFEVSNEISSRPIKELQSESYLAFLHRLAEQSGAILKLKDKKLVLATKESLNLPEFNLASISKWAWSSTGKDYKCVKALYWDKSKKKTEQIIVGEDGPYFDLGHVYASKEAAIKAAEVKKSRLIRSSDELRLTLFSSKNFDTAQLGAGCFIQSSELPPFLQRKWFVRRVCHQASPEFGFITTDLECEQG